MSTEPLKEYIPSELLLKTLEHRKKENSYDKLSYYTELALLEEKLAKEIEDEINHNPKLREYNPENREARGELGVISDNAPKNHELVQYLLKNPEVFTVLYESGGTAVYYLWEKRLEPIFDMPEGRQIKLARTINDVKNEFSVIKDTLSGDCDPCTDMATEHNYLATLLDKFKNTELRNDSLQIIDIYTNELERLAIVYKDNPEIINQINTALSNAREIRKKYS